MNQDIIPNPDDFTSRFEYSKSTSRYHFDNFTDDDINPPYKRIGRFIGDWRADIVEMASATRHNTYHGRMRSKVPYLDTLETNDLLNMGLDRDHVLHDKSTKQFTPTLRKMIDYFCFDKSKRVLPTFHVQKPGQVFINHIDSCTSIRGNSNSEEANYYFRHPELLARFIIALEDWQPGHMWSYGNTYWKQWKAGDIVFHSWIDTPHATANASHTPRYSIQVTGFVTEETNKIINGGDFLLVNL